MKLVRVQRHDPSPIYFDGHQHNQVYIIATDKVDEPDDSLGGPVGGPAVMREAEFFLIDEIDIKHCLEQLARYNPGCEVQVYGLEHTGICPAGPLVMKRVTADGVLPV